MTDSPASTPVIRGYQPSDQPGFEALVQSVHAEYELVHDPRLDRDLVCPEDHYARILVLVADGSVMGTAALTRSREDGCVAVVLDTMEEQKAAQRMYERAGFDLVRTGNGVRFYRLTL